MLVLKIISASVRKEMKKTARKTCIGVHLFYSTKNILAKRSEGGGGVMEIGKL